MPDAPDKDNGGELDLDSLDVGVEDMNVAHTEEDMTNWIRSDMEGVSGDVSVIEKAHAECRDEEPCDLELDNDDEDDDTYIDDGHVVLSVLQDKIWMMNSLFRDVVLLFFFRYAGYISTEDSTFNLVMEKMVVYGNWIVASTYTFLIFSS